MRQETALVNVETSENTFGSYDKIGPLVLHGIQVSSKCGSDKNQGYIYKVESTWTLQGYLLVVSSTFSLEGYMKPPLDESKSWTLLSGFHPFNRSAAIQLAWCMGPAPRWS